MTGALQQGRMTPLEQAVDSAAGRPQGAWPAAWSCAGCGWSFHQAQGQPRCQRESDQQRRRAYMPRLELMGMGLMPGPHQAGHEAMGSKATITVKVARMVGPPHFVDRDGDDAGQALAQGFVGV